jgi:hypothetical protein
LHWLFSGTGLLHTFPDVPDPVDKQQYNGRDGNYFSPQVFFGLKKKMIAGIFPEKNIIHDPEG